MSSYFVNSTFPVTLPGGQEVVFLGQIPLYFPPDTQTIYDTIPVLLMEVPVSKRRRTHPPFTSKRTVPTAGQPQAGPCDYATASFYREKDAAAPLASIEEHSSFSVRIIASKTARGSTGKSIYPEADEQKSSAPVYPWMQRMNSV